MVFVAISLVLIIVGLSKPSESAQAIIGFFILFLLSVLILLPGKLEYQSSTETNMSYVYNETQLSKTYEITTFKYSTYEDTLGGRGFGYWLAISSAVGMIGVFYSLKKTNYEE